MPRPAPFSVVVDGIVYRFQTHGGINTYLNSTLPLVAARPGVKVEFLMPNPCKGVPPAPPVRRVRRDWLPADGKRSGTVSNGIGILVDKLNSKLLGLRIRRRGRCIFQSSFATWTTDAVPHVGMAYDLNHELFPDEYQGPFGVMLRRNYRECLTRARRIIAISHKTKSDVVKFYRIDPGKIDVVHLAVDRQTFWPDRNPATLDLVQAQLGHREPYILYVGGRQGAYKNFDRLLRAYAESPARDKLTLVVIGRPWNEDEVRLMGELSIGEKVRLIVSPSDALLRGLYSFANAFVYPSLHEGFGLPLLEAMACGTIAIASDIEVFREVAADAAMYFDPASPGDMGRVLEAALDEGVRQEYIRRGTEQLARYSWAKTAQQTYAVYQTTLDAFEN